MRWTEISYIFECFGILALIDIPVNTAINLKKQLTMVGTNGGLIFLNKRSSQIIDLKNACFFTSSASLSDDPRRLSGFFRSN